MKQEVKLPFVHLFFNLIMLLLPGQLHGCNN